MSAGTGGKRVGLLLEGGGSRTWLALSDGGRITTTASGASTNPRSVGEDQAEATLAGLLTRVVGDQGTTAIASLTAAHGAASTNQAAHRYAHLIQRACLRANLGAPSIRLSNDMTAVLLAQELPTVCAIIVGTGTGFAARHHQTFARASGLEWLLSDEGGAHDLAVAGLRAAVRGMDGRGPETVLTNLAQAWSTRPDLPLIESLFETVYTNEHTKPLVATFAVEILQAAPTDAVAAALLKHATHEIVIGAQAVCQKVGLPQEAEVTIILSGSLLTASTLIAEPLVTALQARLNVVAVRFHDGATAHPAALLALERTWETSPDVLLRAAQAIPTVTLPPRHRETPSGPHAPEAIE